MNLIQKYIAQGTAVATVIVGQVVAYVPAWRPDAGHIISAGSFIIGGALLLHDGLKESTVRQITGEAATEVKVVEADEGKVRRIVDRRLGEILGTLETAAQRAQEPVSGAATATPVDHPTTT